MRILCAFDSPAAAEAAVPRVVELAAWRDADITFLAVHRSLSGEAGGPSAPQRIRRRTYLAIALARAAETATRQLGVRPRAGFVDADDVEREVVAQALAQGAGEIVVAEERALWRRPRVARLSVRPAGARV